MRVSGRSCASLSDRQAVRPHPGPDDGALRPPRRGPGQGRGRAGDVQYRVHPRQRARSRRRCRGDLTVHGSASSGPAQGREAPGVLRDTKPRPARPPRTSAGVLRSLDGLEKALIQLRLVPLAARPAEPCKRSSEGHLCRRASPPHSMMCASTICATHLHRSLWLPRCAGPESSTSRPGAATTPSSASPRANSW